MVRGEKRSDATRSLYLTAKWTEEGPARAARRYYPVTMRGRHVIAAVAVALLAVACGGDSRATPTGPSAPPAGPQFTLLGNPESPQGATWTYTGMSNGVFFDLQGILLKPAGTGPFGAVVISHGAGGNASGYSRAMAVETVRWGLVSIATNYTHAGGVPVGAPGTTSELGASDANVRRAHAAYEILRTLGYVDMGRVAAHGHSMGAFVTAATIGAHPSDFRVASHTAGGVATANVPTAGLLAAPLESQVRGIRTPYQLHHGADDIVVPLVMDQRLAAILQEMGIPFELHVYPGEGHNTVAFSTTVLDRIRMWYAANGVF
jgi:dienelactone hydrolase